MGTNDDIDAAVVEFLIALIEAIFAGNITVEAGDGGLWEELLQFALNQFGADAFVNNISAAAIRTGGGHAFAVSANVAN